MPSSTAKYGYDGPPDTAADRLTTTELWADRRIEVRGRVEAKIKVLQTRKAAVESALARMDDDRRRLVELWYFEDWQHKKHVARDKDGNVMVSEDGKEIAADMPIWKELGISQSTFGRWRREAVTEVARWLGENVDVE